MQHKPFYNVPLDCYLFGAKHKPEEEVTQWALFELMRYYGYTIEQLEVEKTVQYGTCRGRLDILVHHNEKPFIVLECKRKDGYPKRQDPMQQAISYADANSIQAEYCVFTDGNTWQVKRKTTSGWVSYPNIPRLIDGQEVEFELSDFLHDLDRIKPALYWLYKPVGGADAYNFINAIQPIFYANSVITDGTSELLLSIMDNVCRAITIKTKVNGYTYEKLNVAFNKTQLYLGKLDINERYQEGINNNLHELLMIPDVQFNRLKEEAIDIDSEMDHAAIHLLSTLYSVARDFITYRREIDLSLSGAFTDELYNFLNLGLQRNLRTCLPVKSDSISVNDIRESCTKDWDKFIDEEKLNIFELCSIPYHFMKDKVTGW